MVLSRPEDFLNNEVLSNEKASKTLSIWLSAAMRNFAVAAIKIMAGPSIWLLTGVYIMEDARTFTVIKKEKSLSAGISASTVAALTSVAVGASIDIGATPALRTNAIVSGRCVWAAQYRQLDINYFWPGEVPTLPKTLLLYSAFVKDRVAFNHTDPKIDIPPEKATVGTSHRARARRDEKHEKVEKRRTARH
jgi:hypothetical protein